MNPFTYRKKPKDKKEAQENLNFWAFERTSGPPKNESESLWRTYIKEMIRDSQRQLNAFP